MNPVVVRAEDILPPVSSNDPTGYAFAAGMRYDVNVVKTRGTLLQISQGPEGHILIMESGKRQFVALLSKNEASPDFTVEIGSQLQLTGVCLVTYDQYRRAETFRILLRSVSDVVEVSQAPWWNLKNAVRIVFGMAILLLLAVLWVARQTFFLRRANASLMLLSFQDGLTGIANRRKFDGKLNAELKHTAQSTLPVSLLMVDIDHFKALNDEHGHQRGDECLIQVARALESMPLRTTDLVARYGGEELAVILPGSNEAGALVIAESMRLAILGLAISNPASPFDWTLSISVGAATV